MSENKFCSWIHLSMNAATCARATPAQSARALQSLNKIFSCGEHEARATVYLQLDGSILGVLYLSIFQHPFELQKTAAPIFGVAFQGLFNGENRFDLKLVLYLNEVEKWSGMLNQEKSFIQKMT